jgi:hypothetical protein
MQQLLEQVKIDVEWTIPLILNHWQFSGPVFVIAVYIINTTFFFETAEAFIKPKSSTSSWYTDFGTLWLRGAQHKGKRKSNNYWQSIRRLDRHPNA